MNIVERPVKALAARLLARFAAIVGEQQRASPSRSDIAPYLIEERGLYHGRSPVVLRPGSTAEVSAILKLANETGTPIVPQGGNTGLVGGQTPHNGEIVLSLKRLDRIREVDATSNTMTCEAGVVLIKAQEAAAAADRLFPLSLGAEGSCTIGGNLSTNAGGTGALAYGVARELVIGLEVVLADGRVLNNLRKLKKDNTGYDLRHIFVGAEGTLGIITAAVLRLFPRPRAVETAFIGVPSPHAALALLNLAYERAGGSVTSFELMPRIALEFAVKHAPTCRDPLREPASLVRADGVVVAGARRPARDDGGHPCDRRRAQRWSRTPRSPRASTRPRRSGCCATTSPTRRNTKAARSSRTCRCR